MACVLVQPPETGYKLRIAKASAETDADAALRVVQELVGDSAALDADLTYEYSIHLGFPPLDKMVRLIEHLEGHKVRFAGFSSTTRTSYGDRSPQRPSPGA